MIGWARRTAELHGELAAIATLERAWWLVAGTAAAAEPLAPRPDYLASDAEPGGDTFIGHRTSRPGDPIADAIARAHAARAAIRALDGQLPGQPLAVTIDRGAAACTRPSSLDHAAFAIGRRVHVARLADRLEDEAALGATLRHALAHPDERDDDPSPPPVAPFVCVSLGTEPIATARHGHRRAWRDDRGPWLGLGTADDLAIVSTCHMVLDGYGHAWLASAIATHHADLARRVPGVTTSDPDAVPPPAAVPGAVPLGIAWRPLGSPAPRALPLAYQLGCELHRLAARPDAPFSPTFQLPIAPGVATDPARRRRRVVHAALSVRFERARPEPQAVFEARARQIIARELEGRGLISRLHAAARAVPVPLAYKRRTFSAARPRWLERIAEVVGGRGCLSRIQLDVPIAPSCAVSSPARLASAADPLGGCVVTVIDDGHQAAITACGSGFVGTRAHAEQLLDALLGPARA